jgi:hypothetical protein
VISAGINLKASAEIQQRLLIFFFSRPTNGIVFVGIGFLYFLSGFSGYSTGFSSNIGSVFLGTVDWFF